MVSVLSRCPTRAATLRVSHQDGVLTGTLIHLIDGSGHGAGYQVVVKVGAHVAGHAGVRSHLAEELVQGLGADVAAHRCSPGFTPMGLVNEPDTVAHPKKHIRPSLAAIGRGHPAHTGLAVSMQKNHGQLGVVLRNLVQDVGMVHMGSLPCAGLLPLILRDKGARRGDCDATR